MIKKRNLSCGKSKLVLQTLSLLLKIVLKKNR
jgi:hypothetical protein